MPPCDDSMVCTSGETGHCDPKRDSRSGPCRVLLIIADPVVANPRAIRRLQDRLLAPCPIVRTACQPLDPWIKKSFDNSPIAAASGQSRPVHFSIEHCRQVSIASSGRSWPALGRIKTMHSTAQVASYCLRCSSAAWLTWLSPYWRSCRDAVGNFGGTYDWIDSHAGSRRERPAGLRPGRRVALADVRSCEHFRARPAVRRPPGIAEARSEEPSPGRIPARPPCPRRSRDVGRVRSSPDGGRSRTQEISPVDFGRRALRRPFLCPALCHSPGLA